ncbi:MAG: hypothetical protein EAY81_06070 [Bacteroidetes bacterium]|nr:MAG: hypothetical protein EAY81_06070 [Bacteroidota bacterium]
MAKGTAETSYIIGLGGLSKEALVYEAKKNLYSRYPLTKGMALGNVTVDFKTTWLLFVLKRKVHISADIIDFNPETLNVSYQGFYTEDSTYFPARTPSSNHNAYAMNLDNNKIKLADQVTFKLNGITYAGKVIAVDTYGIKCGYETPQGSRKIYLLPQDIMLQR